MDIFAHFTWTALGARAVNAKAHARKMNVIWTGLFGVFPDFFAFTISFVMAFSGLIAGKSIDFSHHSFKLAAELYNYSHSLVIWLGVFLLVWMVKKKPWLPLFGWALHIFIDIFSHSIDFYPTPFLFPFSEYRFPYGVPWSNKWYMIINYSALLIALCIFLAQTIRQRRKTKQAENYINSK